MLYDICEWDKEEIAKVRDTLLCHWCGRSVSLDELATLADKARECGAKTETKVNDDQPGQLLQRLLGGMTEKGVLEKTDKKVQKVVHLVSNLPLLSAKLVELIQEGSFVDFAWFLVLEDGPSDGDWRQVQSDNGDGTSGGTSSRKRAWKEVPDILTWSTCFSLFQTAWGRADPKMYEPLMAYRESIVRLAKRHPWQQVVKYDRRFRQEAARRNDVKWGEQKTCLVLDMMCNTPQGEKQAHGNSGPSQRKADQKKRGACFRHNKANCTCTYGTQCRFLHVCSHCGGEHPATQRHNKSGEK